MSTSTQATKTEQLLADAAQLVPQLAERQADTEASRRLPDATVRELRQAGLLHTQLPTRLGGSGVDMRTEMLLSAQLAHGCPSTSWVRSVLAGATSLISLLPDAGVETVLGSSSELPLACGVNSVGGRAVPVDGGYLVNGSWGFASGSLHADWAFLAARIEADGPPSAGAACMPISALTVKDTWYTAGLCGTGSNTLVANDVFVPAELMLLEPPGITTALQRSPLVPRFAVVLLATLLGASERLLELARANATTKGVTYFSYPRQADSEAVLHQLAAAAMEIDSAKLHMLRALDDLAAEATHGPMDYLTSTRAQADAGHAASLLRRAADSIMSLCGASAFASHNAAQRVWRDISIGSNHAMLNTTGSLSLYGRALVGEPSNTPFWGPDARYLV